MSMWNDLRVAQEVAENAGVSEWFSEFYTRSRENNGILESIEMALKALDLWEKFQEQVCGEEA